jgi:hypothetical protein
MRDGASGEPRRQTLLSMSRLLRSASSRTGLPRYTNSSDADPCDPASFPSSQTLRPRSRSRRARLDLGEHPRIGSSRLPILWGRFPFRSDPTQERLCEPWESLLEVLRVYGPALIGPWHRQSVSRCTPTPKCPQVHDQGTAAYVQAGTSRLTSLRHAPRLDRAGPVSRYGWPGG